MGMDLYGPQGYFRTDGGTWCNWLDAAEEHGWKPAGTEKPDHCDGEWDGGYDSNDYQRVTDEDAKALSKALALTIPKIPNVTHIITSGPSSATPLKAAFVLDR